MVSGAAASTASYPAFRTTCNVQTQPRTVGVAVPLPPHYHYVLSYPPHPPQASPKARRQGAHCPQTCSLTCSLATLRPPPPPTLPRSHAPTPPPPTHRAAPATTAFAWTVSQVYPRPTREAGSSSTRTRSAFRSSTRRRRRRSVTRGRWVETEDAHSWGEKERGREGARGSERECVCV